MVVGRHHEEQHPAGELPAQGRHVDGPGRALAPLALELHLDHHRGGGTFNPNGETLLPAAALGEALAHCEAREVVPLPVWSNVRIFDLGEGTGWVTDTIGMGQLDVSDNEACFARAADDPAEVEGFLRNVSDFARRNPGTMGDGFTIDGPGGVEWRARLCERSLAPAPRAVVRWVPEDGREAPGRVLEG